jgi:hypothetical protein
MRPLALVLQTTQPCATKPFGNADFGSQASHPETVAAQVKQRINGSAAPSHK